VPLIALLALAGLYAGDYLSARYRIPGNRQTLGSVQVQTTYAVRLKDGRIEYMLGDTDTQTCVRSLFPQLGYTPCWYLSRHATRRIEISRGRPNPPLGLGLANRAGPLHSAAISAVFHAYPPFDHFRRTSPTNFSGSLTSRRTTAPSPFGGSKTKRPPPARYMRTFWPLATRNHPD